MEMILPLPSRGKIYPIDEIVVRTMRGKDEKLLADINYSNADKKYVKLFSQLVTGIDSKKLTLGDRAFIILWERINSYSPYVMIDVVCSDCEEKSSIKLDLRTIDILELAEDFVHPVLVSLPLANVEVAVRLFNTGDEISVAAYAEKESAEEAYVYRQALVLVDEGKSEEEKISFINELDASDLALIKRVNEQGIHGPELDKVPYTCPKCGQKGVMILPFRSDILVPSGVEVS